VFRPGAPKNAREKFLQLDILQAAWYTFECKTSMTSELLLLMCQQC